MRRKRFLQAMMAASMLWMADAGRAGAFPDKPVRILVPFTAGGPTDVFFRRLGEELQKVWRQPVVIENRPGANETIAAIAVADAKPDGHTLFGASEGALLLNPLLYKNLKYDPYRDFAPVTQLANGPLIFTVSTRMPVRSWSEFVRYAQERQEPIRFGNTGIGGTTHLSFGVIQRDLGIAALHVTYRGVINVLQDLLGGVVDAGAIGAPLLVPYVREGRLKALAVPGDRRVPSLPEVPTFEELGLPQMRALYELTLVAPKGVPEDVVRKIARDAATIVRSDAFREAHLDPFGLVAVGSTPEAFGRYLEAERPMRARLIEASGVQSQ